MGRSVPGEQETLQLYRVSGAGECRSWKSGSASPDSALGFPPQWQAPRAPGTSRWETYILIAQHRSVMGKGTASPPLHELRDKSRADLGFSLWTKAWKSTTCRLGHPCLAWHAHPLPPSEP